MSDEARRTKRNVRFRQCDLERAIRAAQATGAGQVIVHVDGTIVIDVAPISETRKPKARRIEEVVF